jgi:hypothetical protein
MIRWLLTAPEAKQRILDWGEDARDIVARWRAVTATHDNDGRLRALVEELKQLSPEFGRWWEEHDVSENRSRLRRFRLPDGGVRVMRLIAVRAAEFEPWIVVLHLPIQAAADPPAG